MVWCPGGDNDEAEAIQQKLRDQLPALKALAGIGIEVSRVSIAPDEAPEPRDPRVPNENEVTYSKDADRSANASEAEVAVLA